MPRFNSAVDNFVHRAGWQQAFEQSDKPVENPGIAARFTLGPEAVVEKVRHAFISDKPKLRYGHGHFSLVDFCFTWGRHAALQLSRG
jgi:hypothetical protein